MSNRQAYLRFLNLARAIRQLPSFPALDALEENLLNTFGAMWHENQKITVLDAMRALPDISPSTAHRRLKTLRQKGLIALEPDKWDSRTKYVVPTPLAAKYFHKLGGCLNKALSAE